MARVLFVTREDITSRTPIGGNVDSDKYMSFVYDVQEIHLQSIIGTQLLEKLYTDITGSTLTGKYETLVNTYIKPFVSFYAVGEYMAFANFSINNGGVYAHESENSVAATRADVNALSQQLIDKAEHWGRRMYDYLSANVSDFPEWNEYQTGDMPKYGDSTRVSWVL